MNRTSTFIVAALLGACSTDTDLTNRPLFDNGVNVFEANVLDGLTGATVEKATVSVQVGRHTLESSPQAEGSGSGSDSAFFSVYGIPYGQFRVTATATGYNDFVALKWFDDSNPSDSLANGDPLIYYFNNILMYPSGSVPMPVTISVFDGNSGAPVANATVVAALDDTNSLISISDPLYPDVGLKPTTFAKTTGPDGKVDLDAASLIMGGVYSISVYGALDAQGVYLVPATNYSVTVGESLQQVVVFLDRPNAYPVAIKANNEDSATHPNLQITFPYPIEICAIPAMHYWQNNSGTTPQPDPTTPVGVALSSGDTVLTLTPNVASGTNDTAMDLTARFYNLALKPKGASDNSCTDIYYDGIALRSSGYVSPYLKVRDL